MRRTSKLLPLIGFCAIIAFACASSTAAPFVNLDFEQATVVNTGPNAIDAAAAFPGWIGRIGNFDLTNSVYYDYGGAGEGIVALFDQPHNSVPLLQGHYMAYLINDIAFHDVTSLRQTGDVPAGTRSLRFVADLGSGPPVVRISGVAQSSIFLALLDTTPPFHRALYGFDITALAGSTVELRFESDTHNQKFFDDVQFSTTPVPEPAAIAIVVVLETAILSRASANKRRIDASKGRNHGNGKVDFGIEN